MLSKKSIIIVLLVVFLAVFVYYSNKRAKITDIIGNSITSVYEDAISSIVIENQKGKITLVKKDDNTWILGENNFPVDRAKIGQLLEFLNLNTIKSIAANNQAKHSNYFVLDLKEGENRTEKNGVTLSILKQENLVFSLILGKTSFSPERLRYLRYPEQIEVYSTTIGSLPDLNEESKIWVDKSLYKFTDKNAVALTFKKGEKSIELKKEGKIFISEDGTVDNREVKFFIKQLGALEYEKPVIKTADLKQNLTTSVEFQNASKVELIFWEQEKSEAKIFYLQYKIENPTTELVLAQEISQDWFFQITEEDYSSIIKKNTKDFYKQKK